MTTRSRKDFTPADRNWTDIGSDVNWIDYGGSWARKLSDTEYLVLRFENCEEWGDGASGYHATVYQVDLNSPQLSSALKSCDVCTDGLDEYGNQIAPETYRLMQVAACAQYGAAAPLWQESGKNVRKLVALAKQFARLCVEDRAELAERLEQPVNAIGTSAADYRDGRFGFGPR